MRILKVTDYAALKSQNIDSANINCFTVALLFIDQNCAGGSNKQCVLTFFILIMLREVIWDVHGKD